MSPPMRLTAGELGVLAELAGVGAIDLTAGEKEALHAEGWRSLVARWLISVEGDEAVLASDLEPLAAFLGAAVAEQPRAIVYLDSLRLEIVVFLDGHSGLMLMTQVFPGVFEFEAAVDPDHFAAHIEGLSNDMTTVRVVDCADGDRPGLLFDSRSESDGCAANVAEALRIAIGTSGTATLEKRNDIGDTHEQ